MTASSPDGYREVASVLTPPAVSQYLAAAEDWRLESRRDGVSEIWRAAGDRARIMLPLATDYADFQQRFRDALFALGRINGWDPDELQERISAVNSGVARREEPPRSEQIVGVVHGLSRSGGIDDEAGEVIVLADVNGREREVHVPLDGEGHRWAIRAYEARLPFMVTGDLYYERRAWRLGGEIDVDTSFLRHYFHED